MQQDRSLLTVDIIGAQPKHRKIYTNRILPHQLTQEEQIRLQLQVPNPEIRFGRRRYENDIHHYCNIFLPSEQYYYNKRNRSPNQFPKSDVNKNKGLGNHQDTKDIEGAVPGSLQSQAVRNQEIAKKLRLEREIINKSFNHYQNDELSREDNNKYQGRDRSITIEQSICQKNGERSLPPIERISDGIDHVANKLQLRQNRKSFQLEDIKFKNKQALLRIYI